MGRCRGPTYNRPPMPATLLPVLLVTHIVLAVGLFLPSILLPFALRARRASDESSSGFVRFLVRMQTHGTLAIGAGLALTGVGLPAVLAIAFFVQRPNLRRLIGVRSAGDDRVWIARARRQRYVSYAMAGLVGTIGFLMSAKPKLW